VAVLDAGLAGRDAELKRFYPTTVLVTGFDIIFFWVARMMMMGLHFMKEVPFKDVYIHALVRDEKGAEDVEVEGQRHGPPRTDRPVRRRRAALHAGRDGGAGARHQARDLARRRLPQLRDQALERRALRRDERRARRKIRSEVGKRNAEQVDLKRIRKGDPRSHRSDRSLSFNDAANAAYRFVWSIFCDWYVELSKPLLTGADGAAKAETQATAAFVLDEIIKLLHPFMPFITEELWRVKGEEGEARKAMLALSDWPNLSGLEDAKAEAEIGWVVDLITSVRSVRMEMNIAGGTQIPLQLISGAETKARAERWMDALKRLARLSEITFADTPPKGSVLLLVRGEIAALPLAGVVDLSAERSRLEKEIAKCDQDIQRVDKKLENKDFVARAPEEILELEKERRREAEERKAKILEALERLKGAA
jgi:valyl-tRNA synthetase